MNEQSQPAPLVDTVLTLDRSTKGTHVLVNDDLGLNLYFPKPLFQGVEIGGKKFRLVLRVEG